MRRFTFTAVFALLVMVLAGGVAIAAIVNVTLARGTLADREKVNIPGLVKFETKESVDFVHSELTFLPGDATPWHFHPGPTLVTVQQGQITFTMGDCSARTYVVGQSFVEGHPGLVGRAQNTGSTVAKVNVVFITPVGSATTFPSLRSPVRRGDEWVRGHGSPSPHPASGRTQRLICRAIRARSLARSGAGSL